MKIYAILTEMMIRERIRWVNVFSLTLESHDVKFLNVIDALQFLEDLDKRLRMNIQEEQMLVCAYIFTFIENMSQQNANFDCKASIAVRDCRCYVIEASERDNLKYDVLEQEWYYEIMKQQRAHIKSLRSDACIKYCWKWELSEEFSSLEKITLTLDLIISRSADSAHSEYVDLAKFVQEVLFIAILTKKTQIEYVQCLQHFQFSSEWEQLQSSLTHLHSWRM